MCVLFVWLSTGNLARCWFTSYFFKFLCSVSATPSTFASNFTSVFGMSPIFFQMIFFFFFNSSGVKLICPENQWPISFEMCSFISESPRLLWNPGTAASKACLYKYDLMKLSALREQNKWAITKLLRSWAAFGLCCSVCSPTLWKKKS